MTHRTVSRFSDGVALFGVMPALGDNLRSGEAPEITADAKAWLVSLACWKAKDLGAIRIDGTPPSRLAFRMAYLEDLNREPVTHSWTYKITEGSMIRAGLWNDLPSEAA